MFKSWKAYKALNLNLAFANCNLKVLTCSYYNSPVLSLLSSLSSGVSFEQVVLEVVDLALFTKIKKSYISLFDFFSVYICNVNNYTVFG